MKCFFLLFRASFALGAPFLLLTAAAPADDAVASPFAEAVDYDAPRVFTDTQGRAVTGRVREVNEGLVTVETDAGSRLKARLGDLSLEDQQFVSQWYTHKILSIGRSFQFKAERELKEGKSATLMATSMSYEVASYKLTISNRSRMKLDGVRLTSRIFKRADSGLRGASPELVFEEASQEINGWEPDKEITATSAEVKLESKKLDSDYEYVDGSKSFTQDRLSGVWVRLYKGDVLIGEFSEPKSIMQIQKWEPTVSTPVVADR